MHEVLTVAPVDHAGRRVHAVEHHLGADDRGADAIVDAGIGHLGAIDDVHGRRRNGCRDRLSQSGGPDWQTVQAREAHRVRAQLSGPLPSSNDVRRAIHVAFNLVALFMRQPLFGSWPKLTRQRRKVMEITGARTSAELVLQLEGD
jgi:hypothetical protein